jgi:phosphoglycerate dehydrogenase-like enzyme
MSHPTDPLVFVTDCDLGPLDHERELLEQTLGATLRVGSCRSEDDVLAQLDGGEQALMVQWAPVGARTFDALPQLRLVSRYGIGLDMVDVEAATARGIAVANVSTYCLEEVASHAIATLLAVQRRLPALERSLRAGRWETPVVCAGVRRLSELTLGLVGLGRIAERVAAMARGLGMAVIAYDPIAPERPGIERVTLEQLFARADAISLHCPLTDATRHLVSAERLATMRPGSVLVNTARGGLVDSAALAEALEHGPLAGAALDVFDQEPLPAEDPLRTREDVLLTPHAAWYSDAALPALQRGCAENVLAFFRGEPVPAIVNGVEVPARAA